jgi:hypothetical protein
MSSPRHAHASLDGLVTGDSFGDSWFTRSDEPAEELWAAREPRPAPWLWTDDSAAENLESVRPVGQRCCSTYLFGHGARVHRSVPVPQVGFALNCRTGKG